MTKFLQTAILTATAASFALASAESYGIFWSLKRLICCIVSIVLCGNNSQPT